MSSSSPLDHPRLQAVARELDAGNLDQAQRMLGDLGELQGLDHAVSFLALRLLMLRGRLGPEEVAARLRELLQDAGSFPEAEAMLELAESTKARRGSPSARARSGSAPGFYEPGLVPKPSSEAPPGSNPEVEARTPPGQQPAHPASRRSSPCPEPDEELDSTDIESVQPDAHGAPASSVHLDLSFLELDSVPPSGPSLGSLHTGADATASQSDAPAVESLLVIDELWSQPPGALEVSRAERQQTGASEPRPNQATLGDTGEVVGPVIPPAPGVPRISVPADFTPSYVPARGAAAESDTAARLPGPAARAAADTRYALRPAAEEVIWSRPASARSTGEGRVASAQPLEPRRKIQSGRPPPIAPGQLPTLCELARLLDQGRFEVVLEALGTTTVAEPPDRALIRTRALAGLGRQSEALASLQSVLEQGHLAPGLRAACARMLLELGQPEQALAEARRASCQGLEDPMVRLTHAWAAVRVARRTESEELLAEAERLLAGIKFHHGPLPALSLALRAWLLARRGETERAVRVAERALGLDPGSVDGLAALAVASTRLGREPEAEQARLRLERLAPDEARAVASLMARLRPDPTTSRPAPEAQERAWWDQHELRWLAGAREEAAGAFERICRQRLTELVESSEDPTFEVIGAASVRTFTTSPVWSNFAPYDFSIKSLERVGAALELLYRKLERPRPLGDEFPVELLVGCYVGEVLCRNWAGRWEGALPDLGRARIVSEHAEWFPFVAVAACLQGEQRLELQLPPGSRALSLDGYRTKTLLLVAPPFPWSPGPWPNPADLPSLGNALRRSVISSYCAEFAGRSLDGSLESLSGLDRYLELVAAPVPRTEPEPPWAVRAAVLAGAYLGEVLKRELHGRWLLPHDGALGPESYRLRIGQIETTPVATVLARLSGKTRISIHEHASRLVAQHK